LPGETLESVEVWDPPTRVFHWMLALLVIVNFFSAEDEGALLVVHTYCGYAIGLLVIFRVLWGVVGNRHARFTDFLKPWSETRDYLRQLLRLSPPRYVGHNPVGGWMIVVMLVTLGFTVATGMATAVDKGAGIPFFSGLPSWLSTVSAEIHETAAHLMMVLAGIHVIGVSVDWLLTGENIIKAMVTGRKTTTEPVIPAPAMGAWRGVVLAALVVIGAGWMIDQTSFEHVDDEGEEHGARSEEGERGGYERRHGEDEEDDHHERNDDDD
jgi:cytochrome b